MVLRFLFLSISLSCSPLLFRNFADSSPDRQIRTSSECRSAHNAPLERRVPTSRGYFPSAQSRRGHSLANNIARPYSEILIFHYSGRFVDVLIQLREIDSKLSIYTTVSARNINYSLLNTVILYKTLIRTKL